MSGFRNLLCFVFGHRIHIVSKLPYTRVALWDTRFVTPLHMVPKIILECEARSFVTEGTVQCHRRLRLRPQHLDPSLLQVLFKVG